MRVAQPIAGATPGAIDTGRPHVTHPGAFPALTCRTPRPVYDSRVGNAPRREWRRVSVLIERSRAAFGVPQPARRAQLSSASQQILSRGQKCDAWPAVCVRIRKPAGQFAAARIERPIRYFRKLLNGLRFSVDAEGADELERAAVDARSSGQLPEPRLEKSPAS